MFNMELFQEYKGYSWYRVVMDEEYTVGKLISEILTRSNNDMLDAGEIRLYDEGMSFPDYEELGSFGGGKLYNDIPEEFVGKTVRAAMCRDEYTKLYIIML